MMFVNPTLVSMATAVFPDQAIDVSVTMATLEIIAMVRK